MNTDPAQLRQQAAEYAVDFIQPGMVVGLGHGRTAGFALRSIAQRLRDGRLTDLRGIPCSAHVEEAALDLGIPMASLEDHPVIDLTIDGADEVDPDLNLIKGGGGALLREKIVAQATLREIIVVDETKLSRALGLQRPVPVEVMSFGWRTQMAFLESMGGNPVLRLDPEGHPFRTDGGNLIIDCAFGPVERPARLAASLADRAGIVEHGLFLGLAKEVIVAGREGIRHFKRGKTHDPD